MSRKAQRERRLGDFVLGTELGRGGMGVVFEATQASLGRRVALKVLPSHISMNDGALNRFQREAITAGRLNHPGIAKVYSVGCDQDLHFFAMELVEGPSLEDCVKKARGCDPAELRKSLLEIAGHSPGTWVPPSPHVPYFAAVAAWCAEIAEALSAAHRERVLHRDLKPSNILLRPDGSPVLVDFGLSQDNNASGLTRTGDAVGTPAYMAPEQARGERDLDERVDVYGLGATLYELVTLRPPFDGKHPSQIMRRILDEDPVDPCKLNRGCPRDLANIILKCLAKQREGRYANARALSQDLRNFLRGEVVVARAPSAGTRLKRGLQRRKSVLVASIVTAVVLSLAGVGFVTIRSEWTTSHARNAFEGALERLRSGRSNEAAQMFLTARGVLGDARVRAPWLEALQAHAEDLYARKRYAEVDDLMKICGAPYSAEPVVGAWIAKAKGLGTLRVQAMPEGATVTLRRWSEPAQTFGAPEPWVAERRLLTGLWLVAVDAPACVPAQCVAAVERDAEVDVRLRALPSEEVLPGTSYVAGDGRSMPPFLIDTHEVTCREYAEFLAQLDPEQRRAFAPVEGWSGAAPPADALERPVRWIPLAGALSYARIHGGHLPTEDEFRTAGTLGAPWPFPWGTRADPSRVAADPKTMHAPRPAGGIAEGASLAGVVDLIGNVAEWVAGAGGRVSIYGGGFDSAEDALRLDRGQLVETPAPRRDVGFRLAYYVAPAGDDAGDGASDVEWRKLGDLGHPRARTTVRIGSGGAVEVESELAGNLASADRAPALLQLPGGRGLYEPLESAIDAVPGLSLIPLPPDVHEQLYRPAFARDRFVNGGRFHLCVRRRVLPKQILAPAGGGRFEHRYVVLANAGETQFHRVVLPGRARVLSATPPPAQSRVEGGHRVLTFEFPARAAGWPMVIPIEVEFAMDARDRPLPPAAAVREAIGAFCRAWNAADIHAAAIVDPSFTFGPGAVRKAELQNVMRLAREQADLDLREAGRAAMFELRLADVVAISALGDTVRAEALLSSSRDAHMSRRRQVFTLVRAQDGLRVTDLSSPMRADGCTQTAEQIRHLELGLEMAVPDGFLVRRWNRFDAPLQLRFDRIEPTRVLRRDGGPDAVLRFNVLLVALELGADQTAEQLVGDVLAETYPLWTAVPLREGTGTFASRPGAAWTKLALTRVWVPDDADRDMVQKRILYTRGKHVFVAVGTASGDKFPVLDQAFVEVFDGVLDDLVNRVRLRDE